ncbi:MAG: hypothetical protein EOM62_08450 [Bacteroidia bacterium]|nr:hypothetical protein [Bacteroidia bacterium]
MGKKLKRIIISGKNAREQLEEAKKLVAMLEKEAKEELRKTRTRGLILLGSILMEAIEDEKKLPLYETVLEIDAIRKNSKTTQEGKAEAKRKGVTLAINLAKMLYEKQKKETASSPENIPLPDQSGE